MLVTGSGSNGENMNDIKKIEQAHHQTPPFGGASSDLLLELFSEEIPARMQHAAEQVLGTRFIFDLDAAGYDPKVCKYWFYSTPRRIGIAINNLLTEQPDVNVEIKGPKVGAPQAAIDGFLKKSGMKLEELTQQDGVYIAKIFQKGKPTAEILKPLIEEILKSFPWPKSMRWGNGETSWVRPLHSILCIFDGKVVPVEFAGVKAGNTTRGHRFLSPQEIIIKNAGDYEAALEKAFVIANRANRKTKILEQANEAAAAANCQLPTDNLLLEEVTGLVEWPTVMVGTIDKNYMDLPKEVLISEMRAHQKYFALETKDGALADKFLITSNMKKDAEKNIIAGNERVLRARLADGRFFWDQDRKRSLDDMAKSLSNITYHARLGSVGDKVERVKKLAVELAQYVDLGLRRDDVERAAALCKADLVSGMVGEFPELQGVMGRYYALHQKEKLEVADAIRDHYKPQGPADSVPTAPVSICVALAEKLDTLISMFAIGEKPTGSKDPFALRRAALGVIRIVLENNLRLNLTTIFSIDSAKNINFKVTPGSGMPIDKQINLEAEFLSFFHDRLIVQLKEQGIRHDVIKAVVANGDDDLVRIVKRAKAVQTFLDTDDGKNLLAGYKRAANILSAEEKKDQTAYTQPVREDKLAQPEESALHRALKTAQENAKPLLAKEDFAGMMAEFSKLRTSVDAFFDKVMVNDKNNDIRINRLNLLASLRATIDSLADFAKIEGDAKEQQKAA